MKIRNIKHWANQVGYNAYEAAFLVLDLEPEHSLASDNPDCVIITKILEQLEYDKRFKKFPAKYDYKIDGRDNEIPIKTQEEIIFVRKDLLIDWCIENNYKPIVFFPEDQAIEENPNTWPWGDKYETELLKVLALAVKEFCLREEYPNNGLKVIEWLVTQEANGTKISPTLAKQIETIICPRHYAHHRTKKPRTDGPKQK